MEDRINCEREESQRDLTRVEPDQADDCARSDTRLKTGDYILTEVLHVLVSQQLHSSRLGLNAILESRAVRLEDHYAVCRDRGQEGRAVAELGPARVIVERDVGQAIASDSDQKCEVANEPSLEQVSELQVSLFGQLTN